MLQMIQCLGNEALNKSKESSKKFDKRDSIQLKNKNSSFATNPTLIHGAGSAKPIIVCPLCNSSHDLDDCQLSLKKTVEQRKEYFKQNKMCFACYEKNHISRGCLRKRKCKKCNKPHPSALHVDDFKLENQVRKSEEEGSTETVSTYAFYDNGSGGCFLTENLREQLGVQGQRTKLQLGTMLGRNLVDSTIVEDLVVTDMKDLNAVEITRLYTRTEIPVTDRQIPTPGMVQRWQHHHEIAKLIPEFQPDLEIGLLIGSNCPAALEPLEVVPSRGEGPLAMRLRHGWTLNGPLSISNTSQSDITCHRITVRETNDTVKEVISPEAIGRMFELDFNDHKVGPDERSFSQEDKNWTSTIINSTTSDLNPEPGNPQTDQEPDIRLRRGLKIAHLNVNRLICKFDEIKKLIEKHSFDFLALSETWLTSSISDDELNISGYTFARKDRSDPTKSQGGGMLVYVKSYKISVRMMKDAAGVIAPVLTRIINNSFLNGCFPKRWKSAKVFALFKDGERTSKDNYRPISVLSAVSKVIERIAHDQLGGYLKENSILTSTQFGFRANRSTEMALTNFTDDILKHMDNKQVTGVVYLDLKKAFDTVNHQVQMKKLKRIGVQGQTLCWFQSFLSNRSQQTIIANSLSESLKITVGVPQGSILGQLLFIIYINDDIAMFCPASTAVELQAKLDFDLQGVMNWLRNNKLLLNVPKSKLMIIGNSRKLKEFANIQLIANDTPLERVQNFKYLGVVIDENLSWKSHIEKLR
ncbi:Hypothetical predicted protein [Paramuricea clavata]|uniref:Uncharacterized protein n=1 Tax=Paramuricea clavata TaxID=317549 RepID=A0A7D9HLW5_PARCT|nr:Hypothetical predicted protein [Paramuricea clavata]